MSLRTSKALNAEKQVVNQGEKPLTQKEFLASSCHVFDILFCGFLVIDGIDVECVEKLECFAFCS